MIEEKRTPCQKKHEVGGWKQAQLARRRGVLNMMAGAPAWVSEVVCEVVWHDRISCRKRADLLMIGWKTTFVVTN